MSLEFILEDRRRRNFLRDGVMEASDRGVGVCSTCGSTGHLLNSFGMDMCDHCCERVIEFADSVDLDIPSPSDVSESFLVGLVNEAKIYFDLNKMKAAAAQKYNGDLVDFCRGEYNCTVEDILPPDRLNFSTATTTKGKSRINQLMIDFDGEFSSERAMNSTVPDSNGTIAPPRVKGKGMVSRGVAGTSTPTVGTKSPTVPAPSVPAGPKPASVKSSGSSSSSSASVSVVPSGPVSSNGTSVTFGMGDVEVTVTPENTAGGVDIVINSRGKSYQSNVCLSKSFYDLNEKEVSKEVKKMFMENPQEFFSSFEGISNGVYKIFKYDLAEFAFDEDSFEKSLSMVSVVNGKKAPKVRYEISGKELFNRSELANTLTGLLENKLMRKFPALFTDNKIRTSVGNAIFDYKGLDSDGYVMVKVDWAGISFTAKTSENSLKDVNSSKKFFYDALVSNLGLIIPDFDSIMKEKNGKYYGSINNGFTTIELLRDEFSSGKIVFLVNVAPNGVSVGSDEFEYRKDGISVVDFVGTCVDKIMREVGADTGVVLGQSAYGKFKNPSKKQALMDKLSKKVRKLLEPDIPKACSISPDDVEFEVDIMVNKSSSVTSATITVIYSGEDKEEFKKMIQYFVKKSVNWLSIGNGKSENGEMSVELYVKDGSGLTDFGDAVQIFLLESAIMEAFGITRGRMTFIV